MQFIQETGFTFELEQIENDKRDVDDLLRLVEEQVRLSAWHAPAISYGCYGYARLVWKRESFLVWFCENGDTVTLRSIVSACP